MDQNPHFTIRPIVSVINGRRSPANKENCTLRETNFARYSKEYRKTVLKHQMSLKMNQTCVDHFKKHKNLVETNKLNLNYRIQPKKEKKPISTRPIANKKQYFIPKSQQELMEKYMSNPKQQVPKIELNSINLEHILKKNCLKTTRNLLGYNILYLEKKYDFSRFQLHTLYSTYNTLLTDAKFSVSRFKEDFQVMLNMNKITVRAEVLNKLFNELKVINFQTFVETYSKIDQLIYKQNIIDYVEILFEGIYDKERIRFDDIVRILKNRITDKEASDIARLIYEEYDRPFEFTIDLKEIAELCHNCQSFSKKMYRLYTREVKLD